MRKLAAIGVGVAAYVAVAACAHTMDTVRTSSVDWNLHLAGSEAKLAYGQPNSDLVGLMMSCERGSGAVLVSGDVTPERPVLVLASGRQTLKLQGDASPDPYTGGLFMEAETSTEADTLKRFQRTGDLALKQRLGKLEMRASDNAKGDIRKFFAHCEA